MKKTEINIAVIGLGYWGPNIVRNLLKNPAVSKVYCFDIDKTKLKKIHKEFPNTHITSSLESIINEKNIDSVIIATPISSHFALAKKALQANKHVLLEKPMTSTSKEAIELISLAKKNKRILMVGYTFVYSSPVKKIKELIDSNQLGKIYYYDSTRVNLGLIQSDTNVIWDLACHDLSILNYLFSAKPISVQASASKFINKTNYEIANLIITYENNITAHINVSWLSPVKLRSIIVGGSEKMVVWNDIEPSEKIKIYDKGVIQSDITPFSPAYRSGDIVIPKLDQTEALYAELSHFLDCIRYEKKPITSGEDGLKTIKLLEAIENALITHKKIQL